MKQKTLLTFLVLLISVSVFSQTKWTLKECIDYGLKNNLSVQNENLSVLSNEINLDNSKMQRLPNLNLGGNVDSRWGRSIDRTTNLFVSQRLGTMNAFASTNLTVFNGNSLNNGIKQAEVDLESSRMNREDMKNQIGLNILTNYLNVIFNKELLSNARFQLETTEKQVDRTQRLVDAGSVPLSNLLDLKSQQASNELDIINRDNSVNISLLQLKQSMQIPSGEPFDIVVPEMDANEFQIIGVNLEEIYRLAEQTQPDVKVADLNIESAEFGEQIAKAQILPSVTLSGNVFTNYSDIRDAQRFVSDGTSSQITPVIGFLNNNQSNPVYSASPVSVPGGTIEDGYSIGNQFNDNLSQTVGLNLNIPIFNRGNNKAGIQRASIQKERAKVNAEQVRNSLRQTIETAYNDANAAAKSYEASISQVEALQESFRMTEQRYNLGAINFVDYQIANNNLFGAKSALLRSKYDYIFKIKVLEFYQGKPIAL